MTATKTLRDALTEIRDYLSDFYANAKTRGAEAAHKRAFAMQQLADRALAAADADQAPDDLHACANCLRPKCEHNGKLCPPPFTTWWSAWDYVHQPMPEYPEYAARPAPVGAVPDTEGSEYAGIRLRAVAKLVGLPDGAVPADDEEADACRFAILGQIAGKLRAAAPAAPIVGDPAAWMVESEIGSGLRAVVKMSIDEQEIDRFVAAEQARYAGCEREKITLYRHPAAEHAKPEPVEQAPLAFVLDFVPEAPDGIAEEALTPDEFALYSAMSDISEERWFAGWMGGNEYELWSALQDGEIGDFNRNTLAYIAAMSVKTGKWIVWHSDADASLSGPRAVSLFDWMAIYDAKNDMRASQQAGAVDGVRYRWLREEREIPDTGMPWVVQLDPKERIPTSVVCRGVELDAAVDRAIASANQGGE